MEEDTILLAGVVVSRAHTPNPSGSWRFHLGLPEADEALAKAELAQKIVAIIHERRRTQTDAAAILGIDQPKVSALMRGRLSGCSTERLLRFLLLLGRDVEINVKTRPRSRFPIPLACGLKSPLSRTGTWTSPETLTC